MILIKNTGFVARSVVVVYVSPNSFAISSIAAVVERFATIIFFPGFCEERINLMQSAKVYSSEIAVPASSTIASLSASGSWAKPISAPSFLMRAARSLRFSGVGSAPLPKGDAGRVFIDITLQPSFFNNRGVIIDPAPLQQSIATLNLDFLIIVELISFKIFIKIWRNFFCKIFWFNHISI